MPEQIKVFISHNHVDRKIANVVNLHLQKWGVKKANIFLSSAPKQGTTPGDELEEQLIRELSQVNLFILIYTFADLDWNYCTLEYGIVTGSETVNTRVIAFQCTTERPKWFRSQVRVPITRDGIRNFTEKFHREPGFIPNLEEGKGKVAFRPTIGEEILEDQSNDLYDDLKNAIPSGKSSSRVYSQ